jgi:ABC-type dipeptide/oligopeptide/nickel transport system permease component
MSSSGIGPSTIELGPVRVRLAGVTRADEAGEEIPSLATPTVAEATAALNRTARVSGADAVERVGSDYRRTMLANGLTPQILVEVQAWGTAVREAAETGEPPND